MWVGFDSLLWCNYKRLKQNKMKTNLTSGLIIAMIELAKSYDFRGCMQYSLNNDLYFSCGFHADNTKLLAALISICVTSEVSFEVDYSGLGAVNFRCK